MILLYFIVPILSVHTQNRSLFEHSGRFCIFLKKSTNFVCTKLRLRRHRLHFAYSPVPNAQKKESRSSPKLCCCLFLCSLKPRAIGVEYFPKLMPESLKLFKESCHIHCYTSFVKSIDQLNYFVIGGSFPRISSSLRNLKRASKSSYMTSLTEVRAVCMPLMNPF